MPDHSLAWNWSRLTPRLFEPAQEGRLYRLVVRQAASSSGQWPSQIQTSRHRGAGRSPRGYRWHHHSAGCIEMSASARRSRRRRCRSRWQPGSGGSSRLGNLTGYDSDGRPGEPTRVVLLRARGGKLYLAPWGGGRSGAFLGVRLVMEGSVRATPATESDGRSIGARGIFRRVETPALVGRSQIRLRPRADASRRCRDHAKRPRVRPSSPFTSTSVSNAIVIPPAGDLGVDVPAPSPFSRHGLRIAWQRRSHPSSTASKVHAAPTRPLRRYRLSSPNGATVPLRLTRPGASPWGIDPPDEPEPWLLYGSRSPALDGNAPPESSGAVRLTQRAPSPEESLSALERSFSPPALRRPGRAAGAGCTCPPTSRT